MSVKANVKRSTVYFVLFLVSQCPATGEAGLCPASYTDLSASEDHFKISKYHVGLVHRFGSGLSAADDPCHDFNGDGICDLFFTRFYWVEGDKVAEAVILEGNGDGTFKEAREVLLCASLWRMDDYGHPVALALDLDADGLDDLLLVDGEVSDWHCCMNNGTDNWDYSIQHNFYMDFFLGLEAGVPLVSVDSDDDGKEEFVAGSRTCNDSICQPTMVLKYDEYYSGYVPVYDEMTAGFVVWTHAGTGDFNGDGVVDFFERSYYSGVRIHAGDGTGGYALFDGVYASLDGYAYKGDFNGDDIDDLVHSCDTFVGPTTWFGAVWYGGAEGLVEGPLVTIGGGDYYPPEIVVLDFDGDGLDDLGMFGQPDGQPCIHFAVKYSTGEGFGSRQEIMDFPLLAPTEESRWENGFPADFDEDGLGDLCYMYSPDTLAVAINQNEPVATLLQAFTGRVEGSGQTRLEWTVSGGDPGGYFLLGRRMQGDESGFIEICRVAITGYGSEYSHLDQYCAARGGGIVVYRLQLVLPDGKVRTLGECELSVPGAEVILEQNHPNPFNPSTTISFSLPIAMPVRLAIFDVSGRVVRELIDESSAGPGRHIVTWDGNGNGGIPVASGIYYYRLVAGKKSISRKLVLLR